MIEENGLLAYFLTLNKKKVYSKEAERVMLATSVC